MKMVYDWDLDACVPSFECAELPVCTGSPSWCACIETSAPDWTVSCMGDETSGITADLTDPRCP